MRKERKAQIKMFESIAVLIIFFFLIVFGLSFYMVVAKSSAKKAHERFLQLKAIQTVQKLATLPELECVLIGVQIENCFDRLKIEKFAEMLMRDDAREWYFDTFGFSEIEVKEIYPKEKTISLYSNRLAERGYSFSQIPVLIYEPVGNSFSFGALEIKLYEQ